MATEIILTLGEAFEVAYQIALRSQTTTAAEEERAAPAQGETDPAEGEMAVAGTGDEAETRSYRESTF